MYKDYKKYEVFETGRIWSYSRNRFLKPRKNRGGYYQLELSDNNGYIKSYRVHRVVYEAIKGEIPEGMQVNHIDECKTNNHISNLNLMTPKENCNWGSRNARAAEKQRGVPKPTVAEKLTNGKRSKKVAAYKDGVLVMTFPSLNEVRRQGFSQGNVCACCRNCYKREGNNIYKGFVWQYFDESPPLFYIAA